MDPGRRILSAAQRTMGNRQSQHVESRWRGVRSAGHQRIHLPRIDNRWLNVAPDRQPEHADCPRRSEPQDAGTHVTLSATGDSSTGNAERQPCRPLWRHYRGGFSVCLGCHQQPRPSSSGDSAGGRRCCAGALPHLPRKDGPKILYAPQFAVGPGITTEISLVNHGPDCNTAAIQVRLFENSGTQIGRHRELFIPCGGKLRLTGEELVETTQELFSAYVEVWSTLPLQGTVLFRGKNGSTFLAALPLVRSYPENWVKNNL